MPTHTEYLTCAETAKLLRAALKAEFPGVKFSVRSHTYSMGASIDVSWTDGPFTHEVQSTLDLYKGATFDPMIDLKSYHSSLLASPDGTVREVHFGADYVFGHRSLSPEYTARLVAIIEAGTRRRFDPNAPMGNTWYDVVDVDGRAACPRGDEYGSTLLLRLSAIVRP